MTKGTRLPEDWTLPQSWKNWALAQRPDLDPDRIAEEFRDFWISKTGQNATKLNWEATWRNWVRRQKQHQEPALKPQSHAIRQQPRVSRQQWQDTRRIAQHHLANLKRALK